MQKNKRKCLHRKISPADLKYKNTLATWQKKKKKQQQQPLDSQYHTLYILSETILCFSIFNLLSSISHLSILGFINGCLGRNTVQQSSYGKIDVLNAFIFLEIAVISSLSKYLFYSNLLSIFQLFSFFLLLSCKNPLHILDASPLSDI